MDHYLVWGVFKTEKTYLGELAKLLIDKFDLRFYSILGTRKYGGRWHNLFYNSVTEFNYLIRYANSCRSFFHVCFIPFNKTSFS